MDDLANGISLPQHRGFPSPRPRFDSLEPSQRVGQHPVFRDACHTPNRLTRWMGQRLKRRVLAVCTQCGTDPMASSCLAESRSAPGEERHSI